VHGDSIEMLQGLSLSIGFVSEGELSESTISLSTMSLLRSFESESDGI